MKKKWMKISVWDGNCTFTYPIGTTHADIMRMMIQALEAASFNWKKRTPYRTKTETGITR